MTKTVTQPANNASTEHGASVLTKKKTSQAERPENAEQRSTFPSKASMTPDYDVMAWRLGAVSHADRLRIVKLMRDGKVRSPSAIAAALELPLGVAAYHVRFMVDRDVLTLDHVEPRRGALEHFYLLSEHGKDLKRVLKL